MKMVIVVIPAKAGIPSRDVLLLDSGLRRNDGKPITETCGKPHNMRPPVWLLVFDKNRYNKNHTDAPDCEKTKN